MNRSELNRLHNAKNPYQGDTKKVLCVCSAGLLRSPTAANLLHVEYGYNTRAAGIDRGHALIPVDACLVHWADEIVVTNSWMKKEVEELMPEYGPTKPIFVLDIPDNFGWNEPALRKIIAEKYELCLSDWESTLNKTQA
jgi:predicted protein tyrosine phosphatase